MNLQELRERIIEKVRTADEATLEPYISLLQNEPQESPEEMLKSLPPERKKLVLEIYQEYREVFQKLAQ